MIIEKLSFEASTVTIAAIRPTGTSISSTMASYETSGSYDGVSVGSSTELATVNYNGLIGFNGTDPFAVTTESNRMSGLPTEIQVNYLSRPIASLNMC